MELVIGETLKAVLDRGERPKLPETVRVVCALLDALHYAHGRGIVHRDVKPANVLLAIDADEGLGEVRLTDFGIARIGDVNQTVAGEMLGTPAVMSPEQLRGEPVDRRADLWSVGVILYEMLTGTRPFSGGVPAIFHSILTQQPKPPSEIAAGVPPAFDLVIATALAKMSADRYPDAAAMAEAIRAAAVAMTPETLSPLPGLVLKAETGTRVAGDATVRVSPMQVVAPAGAAAPRSSGGWGVALGFLLGLLCGGVGVYIWMTWESALGVAPPVAIGELPAAASEPAVSAAPPQG
jgi:serine/threonine-protein kinase